MGVSIKKMAETKRVEVNKITDIKIEHQGGFEFVVDVFATDIGLLELYPDHKHIYTLVFRLDGDTRLEKVIDENNFKHTALYQHFAVEDLDSKVELEVDLDDFEQPYSFEDLIYLEILCRFGEVLDEEIETAIRETEEYMKQVENEEKP